MFRQDKKAWNGMHEGYCACVQAAQHAQMLQEEAIKQVDLRRRMRATVVPALDKDVRAMLRQLGEPVTLFGEQEVCTCQPLHLCCMMHLKSGSALIDGCVTCQTLRRCHSDMTCKPDRKPSVLHVQYVKRLMLVLYQQGDFVAE